MIQEPDRYSSVAHDTLIFQRKAERVKRLAAVVVVNMLSPDQDPWCALVPVLYSGGTEVSPGSC